MAAKPLTQSSPALASSNALPRAMDLPEERAPVYAILLGLLGNA